jgi:hypothetical protein
VNFYAETQLAGSMAYSAPGDQSPTGDRRDRQILARRWPFPTRDGRFFSNSTVAAKSYRSEARVELRSGRIDVSKLVSPAVADDIDLVRRAFRLECVTASSHLRARHDFPLDLVLGGFISPIGTRLCRRALRSLRDLMNPRPSNAPSENHSRNAIVIPVGSIAQEIRKVREVRLI